MRFCGIINFYPRPPRGGRQVSDRCCYYLKDFYPRPPRGGRPTLPTTRSTSWLFLPTPSARRATAVASAHLLALPISTHALREEGDFAGGWGHSDVNGMISTHALREEGDLAYLQTQRAAAGFLPTPSARRATHPERVRKRPCGHFYPRPPRGGRPGHPGAHQQPGHFYPRPPRGGRPTHRL